MAEKTYRFYGYENGVRYVGENAGILAQVSINDETQFNALRAKLDAAHADYIAGKAADELVTITVAGESFTFIVTGADEGRSAYDGWPS